MDPAIAATPVHPVTRTSAVAPSCRVAEGPRTRSTARGRAQHSRSSAASLALASCKRPSPGMDFSAHDPRPAPANSQSSNDVWRPMDGCQLTAPALYVPFTASRPYWPLLCQCPQTRSRPWPNRRSAQTSLSTSGSVRDPAARVRPLADCSGRKVWRSSSRRPRCPRSHRSGSWSTSSCACPGTDQPRDLTPRVVLGRERKSRAAGSARALDAHAIFPQPPALLLYLAALRGHDSGSRCA